MYGFLISETVSVLYIIKPELFYLIQLKFSKIPVSSDLSLILLVILILSVIFNFSNINKDIKITDRIFLFGLLSKGYWVSTFRTIIKILYTHNNSRFNPLIRNATSTKQGKVEHLFSNIWDSFVSIRKWYDSSYCSASIRLYHSVVHFFSTCQKSWVDCIFFVVYWMCYFFDYRIKRFGLGL